MMDPAKKAAKKASTVKVNRALALAKRAFKERKTAGLGDFLFGVSVTTFHGRSSSDGECWTMIKVSDDHGGDVKLTPEESSRYLARLGRLIESMLRGDRDTP